MTGGTVASVFAISGQEIVGVSGTGIFNQTGGTNMALGGLNVGGLQPGGTNFNVPINPGYGTYSISSGLVSTGTNIELVGNHGTGIFTQTGGTSLTPVLYLAGNTTIVSTANKQTFGVPTPGTYNLGGGLFQTGIIAVGQGNTSYASGVATFNFTGGTLQAAPGTANWPGLSMSVPITLGGAATLDTNSQAATVGKIVGNGSLKVVDNSGTGLGSLSVSTFEPGIAALSTAGTISISQLVTASGATFQYDLLQTNGSTGGDLLNVTDPNGLANASGVNIVLGSAAPTTPGNYDLITGNVTGFNAANFMLPAVPDGAPAGETYALAVVGGAVDLVVAVPEPGTLALLGAGLMSLLGLAWRRRKAG